MSKADSTYVLALAGVVGAITVIDLALQRLPPEKQVDLVFEAGKAAIGVIPLVLFGVLVNDLVHRRDARREIEQRRDEFRRRFLNDVVVAYNRIKAVRRAIRGGGIRASATDDFTPAQLDLLDLQLGVLSDAQLDLERLKREAGSRGAVFTKADSIRGSLLTLETYVNEAIEDWQDGRHTIGAGKPIADIASWTRFSAFLARDEEQGSFDTAQGAMRSIEADIWPDLVASGA